MQYDWILCRRLFGHTSCHVECIPVYLSLYLVKLITSSVEDDSAKVSKPSVHKPFPYLWHIVTLEVAIS